MLLEREAELAVLETAVSEVDAGTGALLLIDGAAGAGGTALLRHLAIVGGRHGARVLRAGGAQLERGFPLGVVRQLTLPLLAAPDDGDIPVVARKMLGALLGGSAQDPPPEMPAIATVLHGLHTLLVGLGEARTVVLLVDDLHWADELSLRALAFLTARLRGMRVLIGVVLQDGAGTRDPLVQEIVRAARYRVRAEPLSVAATGKLVGAQFGSGYDPEFAEACHEITGGSPKELRTLLGRAFSHRLGGRAGECERVHALGGSFRQERLRFLFRRDPAVEAFGRAVVVLGAHARLNLAGRLSGIDPGGCAAARAALEGTWVTVTPERTVVPEPGLVRVVEESMTAAEAAAAHRAAAELLTECGFPPEDVAVQLLQVDTLRDGREIEQLRSAAVAARRRGAPDAAARYLRRALLDLPPGSAGRARLLVELAAAELDLDPGSAVRHLAQAAPLLPTVRDRAAAVSWIPLAVAASGPLVSELVRDVAEHLGPAGSLDGYDRELALRLEARTWYAGLDDPGRLADAHRRLAELRNGPFGPDAAERELRSVLLLAGMLTGRADATETVRHATEILDHEPAHSGRAWSVLRIVPLLLAVAERSDVARPWLAAAREHAGRAGSPAALAQVDAQQALGLLSRGDLTAARDYAVRAFEAADPGRPDTLVLPAMALGSVAFSARDKVLAVRVLEATAGAGDLSLFAVRRSLRGMLAAGRGDVEAALAQFLDCGRRLDRAGWQNPVLYPWRPAAAVLSARLGRLDEAARLAEEYHQRAAAWGSPVLLGRALRIQAFVTEGEHGIRRLRESVELLDTAENGFELAKSCLELGERLRETDPGEAERLLARGHRLAEQCGAAWLADHGDGLFLPAERTRVPARRPELTRGEATVAELAAQGRTNSQIAVELRISRRAVEKHLTSSYRKLRIEGRPDLAGALGVGSGTR
ncbi:AAA family ATPase [Amycolatopsis sp. NPDC088138]|uniref:AAA family ATPase n=1 Tax=Amycolatopsis sp. NPDC088138 TaxID=3363938 RepID=UPI00382F0E50